MEINQIQERINKKREAIKKIEKRIMKWDSAKTDAGFKKRYDFADKDGKYYNPASGEYDWTYEDFKAVHWDSYIKECDDEIRRANRELDDANIQILKYNNMLSLEQAKQDRLNGDKIQVIVDFLENWKQQVTEYTRKNVEWVKKYHEADHKHAELHNHHLYYIHNQGWTEEEFQEKFKAVSKELKECKAMISPLTAEVFARNSETLVNEDKLKAILDKEADNKYIAMIDAITEKVGEITDATSLEIGAKGDINGFIIGTNGKVHIETIGAGGYNTNQIVNVKHGQCYHFRTLIKPIKTK